MSVDAERRSIAERVNLAAYLCCRECGETADLDAPLGACAFCGGTREVAYDESRLTFDPALFARRSDSLWQFAALLPAGVAGAAISLGEGNTPLRRSLATDLPGLWLKNETTNPTWAHKDRFHVVSTAMAVALGYARVVSSSTGNHGASMAAYASRAGLSGMVLCPPQVSPLLAALIGLFGSQVVITDWDARDAMGRYLVTQRGWFPATGLDPDFAFAPNPFGPEGHKTIAYEIVRDLGTVPNSVLIPSAGGDTLYGVWKGFRELTALGVIDRTPRIHGCQPAGADVLGQTLRAGSAKSIVLERPESIATSVRERTIGMHAVAAVSDSGGAALTADDAAIVTAMIDLGREGYCLEPASALPLACLRNAVASGVIDREETVVCVMTAAGIKWPETVQAHAPEPVYLEPTIAALETFLGES
ncbi:MAG: pyridoxal-phosphate dependent enzyme [Thermomicrobiales bacterium]